MPPVSAGNVADDRGLFFSEKWKVKSDKWKVKNRADAIGDFLFSEKWKVKSEKSHWRNS